MFADFTDGIRCSPIPLARRDHPRHLPCRPEVEQQANLEARRSQIVQELRLRTADEGCSCLELEDDLAVDHDVPAVLPDPLSMEMDVKRDFGSYVEATLPKQDDERCPIDGLQIAVPQFVMHVEEGADDLSGELRMRIALGHGGQDDVGHLRHLRESVKSAFRPKTIIAIGLHVGAIDRDLPHRAAEP